MFVLQDFPIDSHKAKNSCADSSIGGLVSFEGVVRNDQTNGKEVKALLYVATGPECVGEGEKITMEALARFNLTHVMCIQRTGQVNVGEAAIWVGAWASHRAEAFDGCRYVIEQVKKRLLIWKKEIYTDGSNAWIQGPEAPKI